MKKHIKKLIIRLIITIKSAANKLKIKKAVRIAEYLAYQSGRTYYILNFDGYLGIYNHAELRKLINNGFFKNNTTIEVLKNRAVYTTAKQFKKNSDEQNKRNINRNTN